MRRLTKAALAVAALTTVACASAAGDDAPGVRALHASEAAAQLDADDVVVLDIRTPAEVAQIRVPGAVMIDYYEPDFAQQIDALDRDGTYLMYCRSGNRSSGARQLMTELGFTDVVDVEGGIIQWLDEGLPVEQ